MAGYRVGVGFIVLMGGVVVIVIGRFEGIWRDIDTHANLVLKIILFYSKEN